MWSTLGQLSDSINQIKDGAGEQLTRVLERGKQDFAGDNIDDPDGGIFGDHSSDDEGSDRDSDSTGANDEPDTVGAEAASLEPGMLDEPTETAEPAEASGQEPKTASLPPSASSTTDGKSVEAESAQLAPGGAQAGGASAGELDRQTHEPASPITSAEPISLPDGMSLEEAIVQYKQKLDRAREYIVGMKQKAREAVSRGVESKRACEHAQAELSLREQQMAAISSKMAAAVQEESELREALALAREELEQLRAESTASRSQLQKASTDLDAERELSARLKKQGEAKYKEAVELRSRYHEMKVVAGKAESDRDAAMAELDAQRERVGALQARMQSLGEKAAGAVEAHVSAKSSAEEALKEAMATAGEAAELRRERDEAQASAAEAASALQDLRSATEESKAAAEVARKNANMANARVAPLEQALRSARGDLEACRQEVMGLQRRLRAEGIQAAAREQVLEEEAAAMRAQVQAASRSESGSVNVSPIVGQIQSQRQDLDQGSGSGAGTPSLDDENGGTEMTGSGSLLQQLLQVQRELEEFRQQSDDRADGLRQTVREAKQAAHEAKDMLADRERLLREREAADAALRSRCEQLKQQLGSVATERARLEQLLLEERSLRQEAQGDLQGERRAAQALRSTVQELQTDVESEAAARIAAERSMAARRSNGESRPSSTRREARDEIADPFTVSPIGSAGEQLTKPGAGVRMLELDPSQSAGSESESESSESPAMLALKALSQAIEAFTDSDDVPIHVCSKMRGLLRPLGSQLAVEVAGARRSSRQVHRLHSLLQNTMAECKLATSRAAAAEQSAAKAAAFQQKHGVLLELMGEREEDVEQLKQALEEQKEVMEIQIEELTSRLVQQGDPEQATTEPAAEHDKAKT